MKNRNINTTENGILPGIARHAKLFLKDWSFLRYDEKRLPLVAAHIQSQVLKMAQSLKEQGLLRHIWHYALSHSPLNPDPASLHPQKEKAAAPSAWTRLS